MVTVEEAKQSIAQAKIAIQQRREQASQVESQLQQAKKSLPKITSQQYLRQKMSGLKGRAQRREILNIGKDIESRKSAIGEYGKELGKYEQDVLGVEQEVKDYEVAVQQQQTAQATYNREVQAYETARKLFIQSPTSLANLKGTPEYKYYKQFVEAGVKQRQYYGDINTALGQVNRGEKELEEAFKGLNLEALKREGTIKIVDIPKIDTSKMDRQTKTDFSAFNKLAAKPSSLFGGEIFPLVSASMTGAVVSEDKGGFVPYVPQKKTTLDKVKKAVLSPLEFVRDISAKQTALVSAERSMGIGGVTEVTYQTTSGKWVTEPVKRIPDVKDIMSVTLVPERTFIVRSETGNIIDKGVVSPPMTIGNVIGLPKTAAESLSKDIGKIGGVTTGAYYKQKGLTDTDIVTQAYKTKVFEPQFGTIQVDSLTGKTVSGYKEIDIPAVTVGERKETVRKVAEIVTKGGIYFTPVGGAVFASEVESELRPYDYNPIGFAKEHPVEAAVFVGLGTLGLGMAGKSWLGETKVLTEGNVFRVTTRGDEIFGQTVARVKEGQKGISLWDKKIEFGVEASQRGKVYKEIPVGTTGEYKVVETIGEDIYIKLDKETKNIVKFPKQQLVESTTKGTYVQVTEVKKDLFGTTKKVTLEGSPYTKLGKEQRIKEIKWLEEKGYTKKQAQEVLRYQAPTEVKQSLSKGYLKVGDKRTTGTFRYLQEQPKKIVDERLGLKTRGKKPIKSSIDVERKSVEGKDIYVEVKLKTQPDKLELFGDFAIGKTKPTEVYEFSKVGDVVTYKKTPAKNLYGISAEKKLLDISTKKNLPISKVELEGSKTILITKEINLGGKAIRGGGKKSSPEYIQSLYQESAIKLAPPTPKLKLPKSKGAGNIVLETPQELPSMVGGTGLTKLPYAGLGMYERTDTDIGAVTFPPIVDKTMVQPRDVQDMGMDIKTASVTGIKSLLKTRTPQKNIFDTKSEIKESLSFKDIQKIKQQEVQKVKQSQITKQAQREKQAVSQSQRQSLRSKLRSALKTPVPIIKVPIIPIPLGGAKEKPTKKESGLFTAFARVFGKEKIVGRGTKEKAEKQLGQFLKKELSASGYLETGGKKVKAKELSLLGKEFREGKRSEFLVVEKKAKRLRKGGTGKSIQSFRKKPSKFKRLLGF